MMSKFNKPFQTNSKQTVPSKEPANRVQDEAPVVEPEGKNVEPEVVEEDRTAQLLRDQENMGGVNPTHPNAIQGAITEAFKTAKQALGEISAALAQSQLDQKHQQKVADKINDINKDLDEQESKVGKELSK